ncbi:MAG: hypothetical protein HYV40_00090 [Candidatus Levybacteria bacterium]|nr:hypothetical protein [Candidatus Levybacteria bacterium]
MAKNIKKASYNPLLLGIIAILAITVLVLSYKLSLLSNGASMFTHPQLGYTLIVPTDWNARIYHSPAGAAVVPYEDVIILSPDYMQRAEGVAPEIAKGASIFIRGAETSYKSTEERFQNNAVAQRIAKDVKRITVAGNPAIQYSYTVDGESATNVTLVKDGIWYLIKFQYADENAYQQYKAAFEEVINNFVPKG